MGTHAQLGVRFPDGQILGCYVHYDGHTMKSRIQNYLDMYAMTNLVLLIDQAQKTGGIRSFHSPPLSAVLHNADWTPVTELLATHRSHVIDEDSWGNGDLAESYFWLVDYETGQIVKDEE
jgi:hypothetical protein